MEENCPVRNPESINILLKDITTEIAAGVSLSDFQDIITTLKDKPHIAKNLFNMQTKDIKDDTHQIIDKFYNETDTDTRYDELTKLINDSEVDENVQAWRPVTGDCEAQLAVYKEKNLIEKKKKLEKMVQEQRSTRLLLKKCLDHERKQVETLMDNMKLAKQKLLQNSENFID